MRPIALALAVLVLLGGHPSSDGARPADPVVAGRWTWPVAAPDRIVRGFEAPATIWAAGHRGVDVAASAGARVVAPDDGVVVYAGLLAGRGVLSIDHGGVVSSFEPVTPSVRAGDRVARGERIAVVATGGSHPPGVLHIGARVDGGYVSPLLFLGGVGQPVLLPVP